MPLLHQARQVVQPFLPVSGCFSFPWTCRILLVDGLVQLDQDRRPEDIVPRGTKLEEGGPRLLVGVLEDVSDYGDHVLREQPLVRVRVVLHDRVHQVEDRQFQIGRDLVK